MYKEAKVLQPPSGWDPKVQYIDKLVWSPSVPESIRLCFDPPAAKKGSPAAAATLALQTERFLSDNVNVFGNAFPSVKDQRRNIKIKRIVDPSHPCCGAYGLYAAQTLQPKQLVLDYLGYVEYKGYDPASDYVLSFGDNDLSIDANKAGNEARFCNDFRGIGPGPNVCFLNYLDESTRRIRIGIFVQNNVKIKKGEELLVTYGKSFWSKRGIDMSNNHHSAHSQAQEQHQQHKQDQQKQQKQQSQNQKQKKQQPKAPQPNQSQKKRKGKKHS